MKFNTSDFSKILDLKLLIAYGSRGKFFHLKEFSEELGKQGVKVKLVKDTDFSVGFPSKKISDWFNGDKKFKELIADFNPEWLLTACSKSIALAGLIQLSPILFHCPTLQVYSFG